jgi:hypothetical protein
LAEYAEIKKKEFSLQSNATHLELLSRVRDITGKMVQNPAFRDILNSYTI